MNSIKINNVSIDTTNFLSNKLYRITTGDGNMYDLILDIDRNIKSLKPYNNSTRSIDCVKSNYVKIEQSSNKTGSASKQSIGSIKGSKIKIIQRGSDDQFISNIESDGSVELIQKQT